LSVSALQMLDSEVPLVLVRLRLRTKRRFWPGKVKFWKRWPTIKSNIALI
jgi:hypothetical protein